MFQSLTFRFRQANGCFDFANGRLTLPTLEPLSSDFDWPAAVARKRGSRHVTNTSPAKASQPPGPTVCGGAHTPGKSPRRFASSSDGPTQRANHGRANAQLSKHACTKVNAARQPGARPHLQDTGYSAHGGLHSPFGGGETEERDGAPQ